MDAATTSSSRLGTDLLPASQRDALIERLDRGVQWREPRNWRALIGVVGNLSACWGLVAIAAHRGGDDSLWWLWADTTLWWLRTATAARDRGGRIPRRLLEAFARNARLIIDDIACAPPIDAEPDGAPIDERVRLERERRMRHFATRLVFAAGVLAGGPRALACGAWGRVVDTLGDEVLLLDLRPWVARREAREALQRVRVEAVCVLGACQADQSAEEDA